MGEVKLRTCDVLGRRETKAKPILKIRVVVQELVSESKDGEYWELVYDAPTVDMCPDAIKRAIKFAKRAARPPNIAATKEAEETK